jgi:hypothetical protein
MFSPWGYAHFANPSNIYQLLEKCKYLLLEKIIFSLLILFFYLCMKWKKILSLHVICCTVPSHTPCAAVLPTSALATGGPTTQSTPPNRSPSLRTLKEVRYAVPWDHPHRFLYPSPEEADKGFGPAAVTLLGIGFSRDPHDPLVQSRMEDFLEGDGPTTRPATAL